MGFIGFNFNLLDQLSFYGFYHQKEGNKIIHFFFVPAILWSVCVWFAYTGPIGGVDLPSHLHCVPPVIAESAEFNLAAILISVFALYFASMEFFMGLSWGVFLGLPLWLSATWVFQHVAHAWAWALGVHLLGWLLQVLVGHIMIEGRKPALLDSLFQSLVLASLFAWMEAFFAVGYRPKLQAELNRRIAQRGQAVPGAEASKPLLTSAGPTRNSSAQ